MRRLLSLLLLLPVLFATGCPSKPVKDSTFTKLLTRELPKLEGLEEEYYAAYDSGQLETARRRRNRIVETLKNIIDDNYFEFEGQLAKRRRNSNILFESLATGANTSINIVNGERAKDVIAAAVGGFSSVRKTIDDGVFRERTTEAIIAKMREARAEISPDLDGNLEASVEVYSLAKAYNALIRYFFAGTLQNGLQRLVQEAGEDAVKAEEAAAKQDEDRIADAIATQEEFDTSKLARARLRELSTALRTGSDAEKTAARTTIRNALQTLGAPAVTADATDDQLLSALRAELRNANRATGADRETRFTRVMQALGMR